MPRASPTTLGRPRVVASTRAGRGRCTAPRRDPSTPEGKPRPPSRRVRPPAGAASGSGGLGARTPSAPTRTMARGWLGCPAPGLAEHVRGARSAGPSERRRPRAPEGGSRAPRAGPFVRRVFRPWVRMRGRRQEPGFHPGRARTGCRRVVRRRRWLPVQGPRRGERDSGVGFAESEWEGMMGIAQKVARDFAEGVRSRGQSYFAKGRVVILSTSVGEVTAKVRGTTQYRVRLRMRGGRLLASCTCPYFGPDRRAVQAHLGDDPGRRRPLAALFAADPPPDAGPGPAEEVQGGRRGRRRRAAAAGSGRRRPGRRPPDLPPVPLPSWSSKGRPGPARRGLPVGEGPDQGPAGGPGPGRGRQAAGQDGQAPALLRARRAGDAGPEPGGHRPGPARAPARRRARAR